MSEITIGMKVDYHAIIGGPVTSERHTVRDVGVLSSKEMVAWISGVRGCVSMEALSPSQPAPPDTGERE